MEKAFSGEFTEQKEKHIDFDNIVENTEIFLAEGEILRESQRIVAREYSNFMHEDEKDELVAFQDLCIDELSPEGHTFVAQHTDPETKKSSILGSVRLVFGNTQRIPPLEAMELIDVVDKNTGESHWPHQDMDEKIEINEICEVGRFVLIGQAKKDPETQLFISTALMQAISLDAREKEAKLMIAIMPKHVYAFTGRNGIKMTKLNGDREIKFSDSAHAKKTRERYPIYWYKLKPSLYTLDF